VAGSRILTIHEDRVSDQLGVFFTVTGMDDLPKEDDDVFHAGVLGDFDKVAGIEPDRIEQLLSCRKKGPTICSPLKAIKKP
jgi:hypothetical protein